MKSKGEFESARQMYKKSLELKDDKYCKSEIAKLDQIMNINVSSTLQDAIVKMSKIAGKFDSHKNISCNI